MTKTTWNGITVLIADDGAWLTDEQTYSQKVYLGKSADENAWRDATQAEYEEWQAHQDEDDACVASRRAFTTIVRQWITLT